MSRDQKIIRIVAAVIRNPRGEVLLVRKRGTEAFMQPGGKLDAGETDLAALDRELAEELGCRLRPGSVRDLGAFEAAAANEPGHTVQARLYEVAVDEEPRAQAEIAELAWVDPHATGDRVLAPLTRACVLPLFVEG